LPVPVSKRSPSPAARSSGSTFPNAINFCSPLPFTGSHLDYATFYGTKLKKTKFTDCSLKETDFEAADLSASIFQDCDLSGTTFNRTTLEKTDFRTARHFSIDPSQNKMKGAKFSPLGLAGLLDKFQLDIEEN
jgi:fluoroquinolone resistance protein